MRQTIRLWYRHNVCVLDCKQLPASCCCCCCCFCRCCCYCCWLPVCLLLPCLMVNCMTIWFSVSKFWLCRYCRYVCVFVLMTLFYVHFVMPFECVYASFGCANIHIHMYEYSDGMWWEAEEYPHFQIHFCLGNQIIWINYNFPIWFELTQHFHLRMERRKEYMPLKISFIHFQGKESPTTSSLVCCSDATKVRVRHYHNCAAAMTIWQNARKKCLEKNSVSAWKAQHSRTKQLYEGKKRK